MMRQNGMILAVTAVAMVACVRSGMAQMAEPGQVVVLHASRMLDVRAMATMKTKGIFAVPTFAILQYYVDEPSTPEKADRRGGPGHVRARV